MEEAAKAEGAIPLTRLVPSVTQIRNRQPGGCGVFIVKLAGACNLNCTYCYVYNLGDTTFRNRPKVMSREVASKALRRIFDYATQHRLEEVRIVLHGGEPLLVGRRWMQWFLDECFALVPPKTRLGIGAQTNGTPLDDAWISLFKKYRVAIGISIDGTPEIHDKYRVNHRGRGSYKRVERAIRRLSETEGLTWGVLVVANPECAGTEVFRHLRSLGVTNMDFLWPDYHHDSQSPWPAGTLSTYFKGIFDLWYGEKDAEVTIRFFTAVMNGLMGRNTGIDALGPKELNEIVIESDGSIEPLDVLRSCRPGLTNVGLNVALNSIDDLHPTEIFQEGLLNQDLLPEKCKTCEAYDTCGGGYMPHRWSNSKRFANESIHCDDLLSVIRHVHARLSDDIQLAKKLPHHPDEAAIALG